LALLWDAPYLIAGLSSAIPLKNISLYENIRAGQLPNSFTFYFAKKIKGKLKGLTSRQYLATPEIAVLLSENTLIMFTGMRIELPKKTYGLFVQNNFIRHQYGLTVLAGWKLNNLRINFSAGCSYSVPHNKPSLHGEVNLGFIIPSLQNEKGNPWSRLKNGIN
jgi:hypothetical protein